MQRDQTPQAAGAPRRLVLRPGVHVLRRARDELQVGLDPDRAVVLPDRAEVRGLLDRLEGSTGHRVAPGGPSDPVVDALAAAGLLVDSAVALQLTGATRDHADAASPQRATVAAVVAQEGEAAARLLDRRARVHVEVAACGHPAPSAPLQQAARLLDAAGIGRSSRPDRRVALLVAVGEPGRERVDAWMRDGVPHLLVRFVEGRTVIGPFVVPGAGACVRCIDAHHTDADPAWPLLVLQHDAAVSRTRADGLPEPVDAVLAHLALTWAVRELVTYAEGRVPATSSATLHLDPRLAAVETRHWPQHPECGCSWT